MSAPSDGPVPMPLPELLALAKLREGSDRTDGKSLADGEAFIRSMLADTPMRPDGLLSLLVTAVGILVVDANPEITFGQRPDVVPIVHGMAKVVAQRQLDNAKASGMSQQEIAATAIVAMFMRGAR